MMVFNSSSFLSVVEWAALEFTSTTVQSYVKVLKFRIDRSCWNCWKYQKSSFNSDMIRSMSRACHALSTIIQLIGLSYIIPSLFSAVFLWIPSEFTALVNYILLDKKSCTGRLTLYAADMVLVLMSDDQVLFLELRKLENLSEDSVFEVEWLIELIGDLIEAVFVWISNNKEFWDTNEDNMTNDHPLAFKQVCGFFSFSCPLCTVRQVLAVWLLSTSFVMMLLYLIHFVCVS